jgi:hypothetical protein
MGATAGTISVNTGTVYAVGGSLTSTAPASPTGAQTATGVLTINGNAAISTVPTNGTRAAASTPYSPMQNSFQHAYYEARIQVNPHQTVSGGWPAFWSWGTNQFYNAELEAQWDAGSPANAAPNYLVVAENDFVETHPYVFTLNGATYNFYGINTLHTWSNRRDISNTGSNNINQMQSLSGTSENIFAAATDGNWHTYGCLWVLTSGTAGTSSAQGYVEYYLDNNLIAHASGVTRYLTGVGTGTSSGAVQTNPAGIVTYTAPEGGLDAQEMEHMFIILSAASGWPINVDWVRVWQQ